MPGTPAHRLARAIRATGRLDAGALQASLDALVTRHETLRTTFASVDGEPAQVIGPAVSVPLPVEDLSGLPEAEREAEARLPLPARPARSWGRTSRTTRCR